MYYRQSYGPGNMFADILGAFMMRRQMDRDNKMLANAFNPVDYKTQGTTTNYQFADTTGQNVKNKATQGLLSGGMLGNTANMASDVMGGYTPNAPTSAGLGQGLLGKAPGLLQMFPQAAQGAMQMMPKQAVDVGSFTNPMDKYSASKPENQMTTTTTTKELGLPDIQKQIRDSWSKKVQADIKGMSAEGARQYMMAAQRTLQEQLGQAKSDYDTNQRNGWLETLGGDGDYRTKMIAGIRAGVDPQLMKFALDSGMRIDIRNMGGSLLPLGVDERNQRIINMMTGKPVTAEELQMGLTPGQAEEMQLRREGLYSSRGGGYSGGGGTGRQPSTYFTNYEQRGNLQKDQALMDEYNARIANGEEIKPSEQHLYNGAAARLNAYLRQQGGAEPQQPEQPQVDVRSAVLRAKQYNYSDEEIAAKLGVSVDEVRAITGGSSPAPQSKGISMPQISAPTVGSNNETIREYLNNGTWLDDIRNYVGNKYGR
jgi:hypothetical protein